MRYLSFVKVRSRISKSGYRHMSKTNTKIQAIARIHDEFIHFVNSFMYVMVPVAFLDDGLQGG